MPVVKLACSCRHADQDARLGAGFRAHNVCGSKEQPKARCTVCGNETSIARESKKAGKEAAKAAEAEKKDRGEKPKTKRGAA